MLKSILIITLVATTLLIADNPYLGKPISKGTQHKEVKKTKVKKTKKFRKDDHRYDKRYRDFDYDRNGYYNDDGFYFGFFDRLGYFYNNIYFEYTSQYGYNDRLYRRGYFENSHHHYRRYNYYRDNDWNSVHRYREPNIIVYGNYYENQPEPEPYYYRREGHVTSHRYHEDRRDSYRRDYSYRNSHYNNYRDNSYNRRDSYDREYRRDSGRVINHRFSNSNSNRSSGHIHDRKSNKKKGRLQITK